MYLIPFPGKFQVVGSTNILFINVHVFFRTEQVHCCCFDAQNEIDDGSRGQVGLLQLKASSANDHLTMTDCSVTSTVRTADVL